MSDERVLGTLRPHHGSRPMSPRSRTIGPARTMVCGSGETGSIGVTGEVVAIHIARGAGLPMYGLLSAEAITGEGLVGDRYRERIGFYSATPTDPGARELTLIDEESLAAVLRETGIVLAPEEHRRNITTRMIALDPLVGKRFRIGEVVCEGVRPCPPCAHRKRSRAKRS